MDFKKKCYFKYRNIDSSTYVDHKLPIWIRDQIKDKELKILDYGCGFGQNLTALRNCNYQNLHGVDIEKNAINFCLKNKLNVKELDLHNIKNPFEFKFDIIILSHVIEHIPKDKIIDTLSFLRTEFLSASGKLLISVPNAQSNTDCYWRYEDWTHTTLFTSGALDYVLKAAGFHSIEFIDIDCTLGSAGIKSLIRKILLKIYVLNKQFWNKVTASAYHQPSPQIFSYEIKVKAF